jgi:hypothetical protein
MCERVKQENKRVALIQLMADEISYFYAGEL